MTSGKKLVFIVTGTPGTGKTTFAKEFAKKNSCEYIDGNDIIKKNNLRESYDPETFSFVVDEEKFALVCLDFIKKYKKDLIIDSHLSHYIPAKYVTTCFVTVCDLLTLKKRLLARGYSDKKVRDNLDAEIFRVCEVDAREAGHIVEIIETS